MKIALNNLNFSIKKQILNNKTKETLNSKSFNTSEDLNSLYSYPSFTGVNSPRSYLAQLSKQNQQVKYLFGYSGQKYPESEYHIEYKPVEFVSESPYNACRAIYIPTIVDNYGRVIEASSSTFKTEILPNLEIKNMLEDLDDCSLRQKEKFVKVFEEETGFFDFELIKQKADDEIIASVSLLLKRYGLGKNDLKFIGYDSNCSLGRTLAVPGSDADALFIIVDDSKSENKWLAESMRWDLKDVINQRILSTPANHLPEVLSLNFIKEGLNLAQEAFKKVNFANKDLEDFRTNLMNSSNDFVKCADFNIRLAQELPTDTSTRDKFYKTAMLVELIRAGVVLENNFLDEFLEKIKSSPLYSYSNLLRQEGLKYSLKQKYEKRIELQKEYQNKNTTLERKFEIIRSLIKDNYDATTKNKNNSIFSNFQKDGSDAMGNIEKMWHKIMHQTK